MKDRKEIFVERILEYKYSKREGVFGIQSESFSNTRNWGGKVKDTNLQKGNTTREGRILGKSQSNRKGGSNTKDTSDRKRIIFRRRQGFRIRFRGGEVREGWRREFGGSKGRIRRIHRKDLGIEIEG